MKTIDIKFEINTYSKDAMSNKKMALKNGFINDIDYQVLSGNYTEIDKLSDDKDIQKENRIEALDIALARLYAYIFYVDENYKKSKIELAVAKLQKCSKYEVMQVIVDGSKFTAIDDKNDEVVSGEFKVMNDVIRFVFDDLELIRQNYLLKANKKIKADGYEDNWLLKVEDTHTDVIINELMDLWIEKNPMPEHTSVNDEEYALNKAMWVLRNDEACCFFSNEGTQYDLSDRYELAIKQVIENRKEGETALLVALNYVDKLTG